MFSRLPCIHKTGEVEDDVEAIVTASLVDADALLTYDIVVWVQIMYKNKAKESSWSSAQLLEIESSWNFENNLP